MEDKFKENNFPSIIFRQTRSLPIELVPLSWLQLVQIDATWLAQWLTF